MGDLLLVIVLFWVLTGVIHIWGDYWLYRIQEKLGLLQASYHMVYDADPLRTGRFVLLYTRDIFGWEKIRVQGSSKSLRSDVWEMLRDCLGDRIALEILWLSE
jgi:hypothetical protein